MSLFSNAYPLLQLASALSIGSAVPANQIERIPTSSVQGGELDLIHRTITNASSVISHTVWDTSQFRSELMASRDSLVGDIDALVAVAAFQRKYINYQATYNAFLLGAITEEEFEHDSDAFMVEEKHVAPEALAPTLQRLRRLLPFDLSHRELGEYLEVEPSSITEAIEYLRNQRSVEAEVGAHFSGYAQQLELPE